MVAVPADTAVREHPASRPTTLALVRVAHRYIVLAVPALRQDPVRQLQVVVPEVVVPERRVKNRVNKITLDYWEGGVKNWVNKVTLVVVTPALLAKHEVSVLMAALAKHQVRERMKAATERMKAAATASLA